MQLSVPLFKRCFIVNWPTLFFYVFLIALLASLGVWQLHRGQEKKQILANYKLQSQQIPVDWQTTQALPQQYQAIKVQGNYLPMTLFLDNQFNQHQFGYHVLTPFLLDNGRVVLIDRGWIKGDMSRQQLPKVTTPTEIQALSGQVYYPSSKSFLLGEMAEKKGNDLIIERIDTKLVNQLLHKSVYPFIIRLNEQEPYGFNREWTIVALPPARHYAYAVQWFAMAGVVFIIFIGLNLKKTNEDNIT